MADQLAIWNVALAHIGQRRLATLTDPSESARVLADEWLAAVNGCLEIAPWRFATRMAPIQSSGSPAYGFAYAFAIPADWVRTADIASDVAFTVPLDGYVEEGGFWYADPAAIFVRYVSNDAGYGLKIATWPQSFADWVALVLAARICLRLTSSEEMFGGLIKLRDMARDAALAQEQRVSARTYQPTDAGLQVRLRIFNAALGHVGRARVAALTEASEAMRALNEMWPEAVRWALEQGPWTWSIRAIAIGPFAGMTPTFGYQNAFLKPDDWLQTVLVSEFQDFSAGSTAYADETGWWFSDAPGLFVRYVSDGPNYGGNLPRWPAAFCDLVALRLAEQIAPMLGAGAALGALMTMRERAMKTVRASDALNTPPVFPPQGSWVAARRGRPGIGRRWGDGPGGPPVPFTGDTTLTGDSDLPVNSDFVPRISG